MKLNMKELLLKLIQAHKDTGWQTVFIRNNSQYLYYRIIGNMVYLNGQGISATHNITFVTLPSYLRPSIRVTTAASFPLDVCHYVNLYANGDMAVIRNGGGSVSNLYFTMSYPLG